MAYFSDQWPLHPLPLPLPLSRLEHSLVPAMGARPRSPERTPSSRTDGAWQGGGVGVGVGGRQCVMCGVCAVQYTDICKLYRKVRVRIRIRDRVRVREAGLKT